MRIPTPSQAWQQGQQSAAQQFGVEAIFDKYAFRATDISSSAKAKALGLLMPLMAGGAAAGHGIDHLRNEPGWESNLPLAHMVHDARDMAKAGINRLRPASPTMAETAMAKTDMPPSPPAGGRSALDVLETQGIPTQRTAR